MEGRKAECLRDKKKSFENLGAKKQTFVKNLGMKMIFYPKDKRFLTK